MDSSHHCLPPIPSRKAPLLQQRTSHGHHRLVPTLHDSVLLRRVGGGVVALDSFVGAVGRKLHGGEFATVVGAQHLELASAPLLSYSLEMFDGVRGGVLGGQQCHPHVPRGVVDE